MIVPYRSFPGSFGMVYRPIIQVKLKHKFRSFSTWALLDSGADKTMISNQIGKQFGIDFKSLPQRSTQGIYGKPQPTWETTIDLEVGGFKDTFTSEVSFIDSPNVGILLGHVGFFEFFDVKLQTAQKQFEIEPAEKIN